jgi:hypothetical protein
MCAGRSRSGALPFRVGACERRSKGVRLAAKVLVASALVLAMAPAARYAETWQIHEAPSAPNVGR